MTAWTATTPPDLASGRVRPAAAVIAAAPALLLASELVAPRSPEGLDDAGRAAFVLDHLARLQASWLLGLVAAGALAATYVLLATHLTGRGRVLTRVAAVLGTAGATGLAGHMAVSMASARVLADNATAYGAAHAARGGLVELVTVLPVVVGLNLAVVLVAIAALRAGLVRWWVVVAGALALVADLSPTTWNTVLHAGLATAVLGVIAARLPR